MRCGPDYLTCYHHWRLVPADLKQDLLDAYQLARTAARQRKVQDFTVVCILNAIVTPRPRKAPAVTPRPLPCGQPSSNSSLITNL